MKEPTMGKITSMHFAGWKLGLKTGMYYLRTMAASAPIQFTVDQEQLKVEDTNIARTAVAKKRPTPSPGYGQSAVPRPMYVQKTTEHTLSANGVPTPRATPPPPSLENKTLEADIQDSIKKGASFKVDSDEGDSPKLLTTDPPAGTPQHDDALPEVTLSSSSKKQQEDTDETSKDREADIYADKVLQCSIENKDACVMCSG
ncbi:MAG: hypothetical protein M1825_003396 [Sarcosagium campestre]|nr:MAG: hypothetical protein M1825_003396 [Sarcosagium campestre]